ncbi:hypothetical protein CGRA01v4_14152 [Colletotrichum graminicola]|nr:hypothetical protein CGRA01v4_14152 [Colletotrichum graminicola]
MKVFSLILLCTTSVSAGYAGWYQCHCVSGMSRLAQQPTNNVCGKFPRATLVSILGGHEKECQLLGPDAEAHSRDFIAECEKDRQATSGRCRWVQST